MKRNLAENVWRRLLLPTVGIVIALSAQCASAQQAEADSRGLEFVRFQDRVILKVTGNYNAAYDTNRMTQNERAANTFRTVVLPILALTTTTLPQDIACDGIGFEISYHARSRERSYDFEGKENLVLVLDRIDAWALSGATTDQIGR